MVEQLDQLRQPPRLPIGGDANRSTGLWGILTLIVTESALFGYLLFSYYYLLLQSEHSWPPEGLPKLTMSFINTILLLSSSVFVWGSERCLRRHHPLWSVASMLVAIALGIAFIAIQIHEWRDKGYGISSNLYGSLYFTITGFHLAHVAIGLVILALLALWTALGYFDDERFSAIRIGSLYWHFVDVVWLFIFSTFFLLPYVMR